MDKVPERKIGKAAKDQRWDRYLPAKRLPGYGEDYFIPSILLTTIEGSLTVYKNYLSIGMKKLHL